jgi:hypothetical protein
MTPPYAITNIESKVIEVYEGNHPELRVLQLAITTDQFCEGQAISDAEAARLRAELKQKKSLATKTQ